MQYWTEFMELILKWWVAILIPIAGWLNKKRKDYQGLVDRVTLLETKLDGVASQLDEDRVERKHTSDKIDKIYDVVMQVKEDTAVNAAKIDNKL